MEKERLHALIQLLDDPDREVSQHVTDELLSMGESVIPSLENAWEDCLNPTLQERIEEVVHKIQYEDTVQSLSEWAQQDSPDLLEGLLLVNRYKFPGLDKSDLLQQIKDIEREIWIELNNNLTAFEKVNVFNHVFYELYGFKGNTSNFLHPDNCFLNKVLSTQEGTPISLGALYIVLAERLHLPIYGVNLPQHFILAYKNQGGLLTKTLFPHEEEQNNILFYINPFNEGAVFTQKEIIDYLEQLKINPKKPDGSLQSQYFYPCNNVTIITQLLLQLKSCYQKLGYHEKEKEVGHLQSLLQ
jgi:regulator of sirC expression with transglutaminase-like and TPR domain